MTLSGPWIRSARSPSAEDCGYVLREMAGDSEDPSSAGKVSTAVARKLSDLRGLPGGPQVGGCIRAPSFVAAIEAIRGQG
jgi:hypothetical protein